MKLINKYRPNSLDEVAGNNSVVNSLTDVFESNIQPLNTILTGTTGAGKTTLARIIAKTYVGTDSITQAKKIGAIIEYNCGNKSKIDEVRQLLQDIEVKSMFTKKKAVILDEFHKISPTAQEEFLGTLEESPEGVLYIIATTDPNKIKPAVKSRCTLYTLGDITEAEAYAYISKVMKAEKMKPFSKKHFTLFWKSCENSLRNMLTYVEQYGRFSEEERDSVKVLSFKEESDYMVQDYVKASTAKRCKILGKFDNKTPRNDLEKLRLSICYYLTAILRNNFDESLHDDLCNLIKPLDEIVPLADFMTRI